MFVGERGVGADRVLEIAKFAGGLGVEGVHGNHAFEESAGLGVFADLAVLHGEGDAGIRQVGDVALPTVGDHRGIREAIQCLAVFVNRLLIVPGSESGAAFIEKGVGLGDRLLAADHFALGETAEAGHAFAGMGNGEGDGHGGCHGH